MIITIKLIPPANNIVPIDLNFRKLKNHTLSTMDAKETGITIDFEVHAPPQKLSNIDQIRYINTVMNGIRAVLRKQYRNHTIGDWGQLDNFLNN